MLGDHRKKKKEAWQENLPLWRQLVIEIKEKYRKANIEMKGLLPFLIAFMVILILANFLPMFMLMAEPKPDPLPSCVRNCFWRV